MPIFKSTRFRESALANELLSGLKGIEVGGAAHNAFGLDTVNVDRISHDDPRFAVYAEAQKTHGDGHTVMPVDIVAPGDKIPVADKSFDFVISSHVIEHFFDPIAALKEWARIARKYIYIICPQPRELPSDREKLITSFDELMARHSGKIKDPGTDEHHTRWTCDTFRDMCRRLGYTVSHWQEIDDKVGNGFTVVIDLQGVKINVPTVTQLIVTAEESARGKAIVDKEIKRIFDETIGKNKGKK